MRPNQPSAVEILELLRTKVLAMDLKLSLRIEDMMLIIYKSIETNVQFSI
jgi:hypothetical protein